jgi:hypothetical protein
VDDFYVQAFEGRLPLRTRSTAFYIVAWLMGRTFSYSVVLREYRPVRDLYEIPSP